jgi:ubiquitin-like modifier-activating enzyme ATG7
MTIVKYVPFQSSAEPSFWMKLGEHKLNTIKLSEDLTPLRASYAIQSNIKHRSDDSSTSIRNPNEFIPGRMRLDQDSISIAIEQVQGSSASEEEAKTDLVLMKGNIKILNTIESFKTVNKNELLNESCLPSLMEACGVQHAGTDDGTLTLEENLDALASFFCLCHLDLKSHKVVYWFAFPVLAPITGKSIQYAECISDSGESLSQQSLKYVWSEEGVADFHKAVYDLRMEALSRGLAHPPFFMVITEDGEWGGSSYRCLSLSLENYSSLSEDEKERCKFAFLDPTSCCGASSEIVPVGWTLRNLIAYLTLKLGIQDSIEVVSYRPGLIRRIDNESTFNPEEVNDSSLMLRIQLPNKEDYLWPSKSNPDEKMYTCMGWELNARSKPGPRSINLAPLLSSDHLAEQATDLNLKLMKWRMIPDLDLEYLKNMNVLLLGAGTLGCSVARTLLGWGVRHFKFVDNGKVSYSNPVRQNLFEIKDCEGGGKDKAIAAADALKRIAGPTIESEGFVLSIPMPGHAFSAKEEESVRRDTDQLQKLVDEADVVFLLTDTRESRWLPTVMARKSNKMMINAALGLDSWLVMRHGGNKGDRLGCYFCNDVVAPENSTNNRTLDQQCTVTRPGLAPLASSMAVELCVSLLHHKDRQDAPAPKPTAGPSSFSPTFQPSESTSPLGVMPHQIRGSIVSYTMMTPTVPAFSCCTGCCDGVVDGYKNDGFGFIQKVCCNADGSYLEEIAGLTEFRAQATTMMEDCLDWDEDGEDEL